jgi:hypothetical protein
VPTVPGKLGKAIGTESRCTYLDLQQVIAANALVVHLVVRVVGIPAALVLDKGKAMQLAPGCLDRDRRAYSLLDAERGAGMSQRTRRP